jgi:hypothetical protein
VLVTEDPVRRKARLVLAHVRERRTAVDVADRIQPRDVGHAHVGVDVDEAAGLEAGGFETEIAGTGKMLSELSPQPIHNSWVQVEDPDVLHAWETTTQGGRFYRLQIVAKPRGGFVVSAGTGPGSKLNRKRNEAANTIAAARRAARRWLTDVVEGKTL